MVLLALAALGATGAPVPASFLLVGLGIGGSVLAVTRLPRLLLARQIAAAHPHPWPAPALRTGSPYWDVAVIGGGIGGLSAGALLADGGCRVFLAEQHDVPGGLCHDFERVGGRAEDGDKRLFRFDCGPHDVSGVWPGGPVDSLLRRLGLADQLQWCRVPHRYLTPVGSFDVPACWEEWLTMLAARFPASREGLIGLFADLRALFEGLYSTALGRGGFPGVPDDVDSFLAIGRAHPIVARWMDRPFHELLASHLRDPALIRLMSMLTTYLGDASVTPRCREMVPLFGFYLHGGFYPRGGTGGFARLLADSIRGRAGQVRLSTSVRRILVEKGRAVGIVLESGETIRAGSVVCNADPAALHQGLLPPGATRSGLQPVAPGPSAFALHLGLDCPPPHPTGFIDDGTTRTVVTGTSLLDPSAAPPGCGTATMWRILSPDEAADWFPEQGGPDWRQWRANPVYRARKAALAERMLDSAEQLMPELRRHIVYRAAASPVTFARYGLGNQGSVYGPAGRLSSPRAPISGLVVAGSATYGPGIEAVVIAAADAAQALMPGLLAPQSLRFGSPLEKSASGSMSVTPARVAQ